MYRNDLNARSPMRVFQGSMHGGLGRGNVGVIASQPGIGKHALLVQIALDDLLRDRKVLHISHDHAVDHVRAYYDEIFHEIATSQRLENEGAVGREIERNRLIFSHLGNAKTSPPSLRGGDSSIKKILETVTFARDVMHFEPDVILVEGFDFANASEEGVKALATLARDRSVELWASSPTQARSAAGGIPAPIHRFAALVSVVVMLEAEKDVVRLRLLKDHENADLAELHLRLDPHSMRIVEGDVRANTSERPKDPRRYRLHSGGAKGAESEFGACAEKWHLTELNYSFEGHRMRERRRGVVMLDESDLKKGDFSLVYVSKRLGRVLSDIPLVRSVLQTIWHQINAANQVFVVGMIQDDGHVRGGTGWGAELARLWKKPLYVFDQTKKGWYRWSGKAWELANAPVIVSENFAGTGTQDLTEDGQKAIRELFARSFGEV